jgi:hypothetical protein
MEERIRFSPPLAMIQAMGRGETTADIRRASGAKTSNDIH